MNSIHITTHAKNRYKERISENGNIKDAISEDVKSCVRMFNGDCIILSNKIKFVFINFSLVTVIDRYNYIKILEEKAKKKKKKKN